jgi:hypothetical protein
MSSASAIAAVEVRLFHLVLIQRKRISTLILFALKIPFFERPS